MKLRLPRFFGFTSTLATIAIATVALTGCVTPPQVDYTAFTEAKPASLLVLPPVNDSPDIKATASVWAQATRPLAEAGYYVLPVALVNETLKQNGIQTASDAQAIPYKKLHEVFPADAAVYIQVTQYGTRYKILDSETRVEVEGKIIDLRTGQELWTGKAAASSAEQRAQNQGGIIGALVLAIVNQIVESTSEASYTYAGVAQNRLLSAPHYNGILPGPRSPLYGQPPPKQ